jgi:hypothetical protein
MKLHEALNEEPVMSSWIADIALQNNNRDITMTLGNGIRYVVKGAGEAIYQGWMQAPSKGQFWHNSIRDTYQVVRLT